MHGQTDSLVPRIDKVLIVPYEDVMFISDSGTSIEKELDLAPLDFRRYMRLSVMGNFSETGSKYFDIVSLINEGDSLTQNALQQITWSVQRSYQSIPQISRRPVDTTETEGLMPSREMIMNNIFMDKFDRFLRTDVYNSELNNILDQSFDCDYILFLSQLEMICNEDEHSSYDPTANCWLLIHFTFCGRDGKMLTGGIARVPFNGTSVNSAILTNELMPLAAELIWWKVTGTIY